MPAPVLHGVRIDIETKSSTDIKFGAYRYAEDPDFEVLIIAYSPLRRFTGGAVKMGASRQLNLYSQTDVDKFAAIITDARYEKHAFNAQFERVGLSKWLGLPNGQYLDPENWHCAAVRANANGVFGTLDEVAKAVRSPIAKDTEGKRLIRLFSIPDRKAGKFHAVTQCWCGADHRQDSLSYGRYCERDVMTEAAVAALLPDIPAEVQREYEADQRINDRGIRHHRKLSEQAVLAVSTEQSRLMGELKTLTGLDNPNSGKQMMGWLESQGYPMTSLDKTNREEALADPMIPEEVAEALTLKGAASLSSVAKHKAALDTRCADGRIRGSLRFYGAHTGREAGRGFQPHNLPRYEAPPADRARLLSGTAGQDAPTIAKGTVRASLAPARDHLFVVLDYNAIEARCLGWQTGETWVEREFAGQGKIYEATAATMFGADKDNLIRALNACGKCGHCPNCAMRAKAKVANLALGYAGGAGALVTMGAESAGIDVGNYNELHREWEHLGKPGKFHEWNRDAHDYPELIRLRDLYRDASPATVRFWKLCAKAWDIAANGKGTRFGSHQQFSMIRDGRHNRLVLPSGRSIWYRFAQSHMDPNSATGRIDRRTFMGKSVGVGHRRTDTHGGSLTENVTQAVARDVLFDLIMKIEGWTASGYPARIVLHVHDEVVLEVHKTKAEQVLADVKGLMAVAPNWAPGLAVKGEGDIMPRYGK